MSDYTNLKLLVAEDDLLNQKVMAMLAKTLGCRVDIVEDGRRALEAFQAGDYDIVLLDYEMPVMDGPSTAKAIRTVEAENGKENTLPIFSMTGHAGQEELERCTQAGMTGHLAKPLSADKLRNLLDQYLSDDN